VEEDGVEYVGVEDFRVNEDEPGEFSTRGGLISLSWLSGGLE